MIVLPRSILFRVSGDIGGTRENTPVIWVDIITVDIFTSTVSLLEIVEI